MKFKSLLISLLVGISAAAMAADKEVEELLAGMRKAYEAVKTAKITSETTLMVGDEKMVGKFDIQYKTGNKVYVRSENLFGMEGVIKVISNGKKISVTTPEEKEENDFSLEAMSSGMPLNLEVMCFWDHKRQLSTGEGGNMQKSDFKLSKDQEWNGKKWTKLVETAHGQGVEAIYWIDPKTNFIWRTEVKDLESGTQVMSCEIKTLKIDEEIADSVFDIP